MAIKRKLGHDAVKFWHIQSIVGTIKGGAEAPKRRVIFLRGQLIKQTNKKT